ncbi:hypothetical protein FS837_003768 [Tulasnella sp. UAMH 9824]|nr:hypothetical protein FS837_003768 [Tulasnella sp. UAMH 9824]
MALPQYNSSVMFPQTPEALQNITLKLGAPADDLLSAAAESSTTLKQLADSAFSHLFERQLYPVTSEMNEALDKAHARFVTEKIMPPTPFMTQSRKWLLSCYQAGRQQVMEQEKDSRISHRQAVIGIEAHVSKTALEHLDRVSFRQMHIRKTHTGKYLLCRIMTYPYRVYSVHILVEDVDGDACPMELYNYPGTIGANSQLVDALFPVGSILAIREPTLKSAAHGGKPLLRVDCPSDVIWLEPDDEMLVGVKWKTGDQVPDSPELPSTEEEWKKQGNSHYQKGWCIPAAVLYGRGLQRFPSSAVLRLNRAMAYLQLDYYEAALSDCEAALDFKEALGSLKPKALYRAAQALYGMGRWNEAERKFAETATEYPAQATDCQSWIKRCKDRKIEATEGKYDWAAAYRAAQVPGCRMDLADFTGPVKVASLPSRGGGRGIVAKRNIKFGELLVVSKAFISCTKNDYANPELCSFTNFIKYKGEVSYGAVAATKVAERIAGSPNAADAVEQLYAGPSNSLPPSKYSIAPSGKVDVARLLQFNRDVDIRRIEAVVNYNAFGTQSLQPSNFLIERVEAEELDARSLFLLPSLFNHSCLPNAFWYCLGDVMIIRATCNIPAGDEVFLSYGAEGDSYLSRGEDSYFRLLGSCNCPLCVRDRQAGESVCNQREQISTDVESCTTISAVLSHIKKLEETFKGYASADQYSMFMANEQLANLYISNSNIDDGLRTLFKRLEYLGLKVTDTSLRGPLPGSSQTTLPIKLTAIGGSYAGKLLGQSGVDLCLYISNAFGEDFNDQIRASKWRLSAEWLHDKSYGGGTELFTARYYEGAD